MAEEDLEALDAAVNGNRIAAPARPQQKENRKDRKGRKNKDEKAPREENAARDEKAAIEETKAEAAPEQSKAVRALYISSVPDEQVEVVITEDGLVTEYFVDMAHQVKIRGNIYKGIINNIDTNLQAAFVNFGNGKNGFLQIDEVHPEYYLVHHDSSRGPKYPPIQKVLKVGQEVLVQVVKEPAGTKGAFLTTWISIAGRFLVLTPGQEQIGVSRKVEDPEERARLKELLNDIQPGENMGVIIRTASEGVNKVSIQQDLQQLQRMWKDIQKKAQQEKSPSLIYQEADLATRSVRDYLSEDIEDIWTDDEETKKRLEGVIDVIFPDRKNFYIKLHKEQRQTMWERFGLLKQLESVTSREVILPSGGRLVFDQTEALMAIDINSGKTQGKTNFEAMVFRTNMEAAEAIARHLRLRDIGGQVVIDFIEMRDKNHCREVERTIRNAMRKDRARHDVGHMSSFGLLELVRQRTGTSAISITTEPCPHCHGTGVRRNLEWQALQAMRDLRSKLCKSLDSGKTRKADPKGDKSEMATFVYESTAELALYILNRKRDRIAALEEKFGVHIEIRLK
ncbi:MAG: Rne/Rng family ribonuclease [Mailhella sp.]|nr:Rne/Rng family ribonuclease [Mailhella sp.]